MDFSSGLAHIRYIYSSAHAMYQFTISVRYVHTVVYRLHENTLYGGELLRDSKRKEIRNIIYHKTKMLNNFENDHFISLISHAFLIVLFWWETQKILIFFKFILAFFSFLSQWDIGKFSPQWDLNFFSYEISTWDFFVLKKYKF